jgi:hypothetical protein
MNYYMKFQIINLVKVKCEKLGGQKEFAKKYGLSPAYVNDVIRGKRDPGDKFLRAMGFKKTILYETITGGMK